MAGASLVGVIDIIAREATLFAAIWFLAGGIDDLLVDCVYLFHRARRWLRGDEPETLPEAIPEGRIAIFVAAWDEFAVIGKMVRNALDRFDHPDYRIYVGTYPNDPATIHRVAEVAAEDSRVSLVIGPRPGPTTKADCLNALWRALLRDEAVEGRVAAVMLHDAEDVVHAQELRVVAHALAGHAAVQLPVHPLPDAGSRFVAGHYCDEFAEAHAKQLPVRQALGAGLPLAGVGCAIRRDMIERIAAARGGAPFDDASLTEDYELGLTVAAMGGRTLFARVAEKPGGPPVAVKAYFPARFDAAVRQKGRWMAGIALAGWDRTGWAPGAAIGDHWMRMRDRRVTLAMPVLALAYCTILLWGGGDHRACRDGCHPGAVAPGDVGAAGREPRAAGMARGGAHRFRVARLWLAARDARAGADGGRELDRAVRGAAGDVRLSPDARRRCPTVGQDRASLPR